VHPSLLPQLSSSRVSAVRVHNLNLQVLLNHHRKLLKHPFNRLNSPRLSHSRLSSLDSRALKPEGTLAVRAVGPLYKTPLLLLKPLNVLLEIYVSTMAIPPAPVQGNEAVVADNNNSRSNRSTFPRRISISRP